MARGLKGIKTIRDFDLFEKAVFLRLDLNVPMKNGQITDETRILASLPTIQYALEKGAYLILASHLGRPKSARDMDCSLEPVGARLSELLKTEVILVEDPESDALKALLSGMKKNQILLHENLRFNPGETKNSSDFAQKLAHNMDIYINDAFGASHRAHASIEALPQLMKNKGIGFLIEKEIQMLDQLLDHPEHPYYAILGGSKVSDKIGVLEKLIDVVDGFIIGGAMAYTFLKAQNIKVGKSLVETDQLNYCREMIERLKSRKKILMLPVDHLIAKDINSKEFKTTASSSIEDEFLGLDIGPQSISLFQKTIAQAKTLFWNGPMGVFENPLFEKGSFGVAKALSENPGVRIVGGGDSAAACEAAGFADKMTHISTGGGASLEYLQGDPLPGIEVLRQKIRS